jgi:hypothetical protein
MALHFLACLFPLFLSAGVQAGRPATDAQFADAVADAAQFFIGHRPPGPESCTGFLEAAYQRVGVALGGGTEDLWNRAMEIGAVHFRTRPRIGDIAFFDNTFDANRNGRFDDPLTHVAIVLRIEPDGSILLAHGGASHGRSYLRMNLEHPHDRTSPEGKRWNDFLRVQGARLGQDTLASSLWAGFATVWVDEIGEWSRPYGIVAEEPDSGF